MTETAINYDEYDSPWKDAVEHYFPEFMAFYFLITHNPQLI